MGQSTWKSGTCTSALRLSGACWGWHAPCRSIPPPPTPLYLCDLRKAVLSWQVPSKLLARFILRIGQGAKQLHKGHQPGRITAWLKLMLSPCVLPRRLKSPLHGNDESRYNMSGRTDEQWQLWARPVANIYIISWLPRRTSASQTGSKKSVLFFLSSRRGTQSQEPPLPGEAPMQGTGLAGCTVRAACEDLGGAFLGGLHIKKQALTWKYTSRSFRNPGVTQGHWSPRPRPTLYGMSNSIKPVSALSAQNFLKKSPAFAGIGKKNHPADIFEGIVLDSRCG